MSDGGRKTGKYVPSLGHHPGDRAIVALAAQQHAVFGLDQLVGLGLKPEAVRKRAAVGRLHRIHQAVYSLVPRELLTREGHWMAGVLACGPGAVLSHRSAAALLGLRSWGWTRVEVTVPGRSWRRRDGLQIHRSATLASQDATVVDGIPCTSVARTLLDVAAVLPRRPVERAFDQAEIEEVFDLRALDDVLARNSKHHGAPIVRSILAEHYIGSTPTQSELEEAFLALCRRIGVSAPLVSEWVELCDGEPPIWADFVWRRQRVIVETDGRKFHKSHQARERDPRRDQRAVLAGWRPIRTTWRQVMHRAHELEPTIVRLLQL